MNLTLLDPFSHNELPEVIETKLEVASGLRVCAFNRRGTLLAGGCDSGHVLVWDFETHGLARTLALHDAPVSAISWTKSSRRLLSSGLDGRLIVWDVLRGVVLEQTALAETELTWSSTHPLRRSVCLACSSSRTETLRQVFLNHWGAGQRSRQVLHSPDEADAPAAADGASSAASSRRPPPLVACFDRQGDRVLIADSKGVVTLLSLAGERLASLQLAGGAAVKSMGVSRDGKLVVFNSSDRIIRNLPLTRLSEGGTTSGRELQDVVNRVQWAHAAFSSDSEHVIGAVASAEQKMYIWDSVGHLTKMLDGLKDGIVHFAYHPTRPILACAAKSGDLYIWTKQYSENWSAFAPDFKELEENEEYEEREDEFDLKAGAVEAEADEQLEHIDILTMEPSELAHSPDADDADPELICLPTRPDPDPDEDVATGVAAAPAVEFNTTETDADRKSRKRKA